MREEEFKLGDCQFRAHVARGHSGSTARQWHQHYQKYFTFKSIERCIVSFPNDINISSELLKFKISKH